MGNSGTRANYRVARSETNPATVSLEIIQGGAKRTHAFLFQIIVNFVYFQYKEIMLTPKQPVINAALITYVDYSITGNCIGKMASFLPYTRPEPLLRVLHHI